MSAIILKVPLTKEEQSSYRSEFKALDKDQLGIITGETLKSYFGRSGLPSQQLSKVWALVDTEMQGFLNLKQFSAAMRCIAHLQVNPQQRVTTELYQCPASTLPTFVAVEATHTGHSTGSGIQIPPISAHDYAKYSQLFDKSSEDRQTVSGLKAKEVFMKAKLPNVTLGSLWALCDRNNAGSLDKIEFIVAMHLIQLTLNKHPSVSTLPNTLPAYLWDQTAGMLTTPLSNDSTGISSSSGVRPLPGRIPSSFTNVSSDWVLTHAKRQQFDNIFDSLDKNKAGSLGADVLVPFFLTSKLSQDTLATIWDLADIHNNPVFTKTEFAIAMFLIQKKNAGVELPDVVPDQLLHSPALGLMVPPNVQQLSQQTTPTKSFQPSIPSRDTKPHFDQVQYQGGNGSALTDLLGLTPSFTAPGGRNMQSVSNNNTGGSGNAGVNYRLPPSVTGSLSLDGYNSTSNTNIVPQEIEQQNTQQSFVDSRHASSLTPSSSQTVNRRSTFVSNLPNVPDFGSVGIPAQHSGANRDMHMDPDISRQLSQATTDLANLSNQLSSLSTQTTKLHEKKSVAERELAQVSGLKASIESKLTSLRASYEQETLQTEQVEKLLLQSKRDTESLTQQLSTLESDYLRVQNSLTQLQQQLQESEQSNSQLKEQIGNYNRLTAAMQKELIEKQQSVKQEKSMVDVNTKQAEISQITVANLQAEIRGLDEHLAVFISKRKELDDYQVNIEKQHTQLESRHQSFLSRSKDLENKYHDIAEREKELKERMKQVMQQEVVYRDQVSRLEEVFNDLNRQREVFDKADQELRQRRIEYAQKVQDLSDKEMKFAMGGLAKEVDPSNSHSQDVDPVSKYVDETLTNSKLSTNVDKSGVGLQSEGPSHLPQDEEGKQDSVFDKDFPTSPSQTEVDDEDHPATAETVAQALDESDMNVYRIPRSESVTSSTANNAPQSLRDEAVSDTQDPVLEEETEHSTFTKISSINEESSEVTRDAIRSIPGGWGAVALGDNYNNHATATSSPIMGVTENTSVEVSSESISDGATTNKNAMDADSGIFEDAYQSTRELPSSTGSVSAMSFGTEKPSVSGGSERQQTATRQEVIPRSPQEFAHGGDEIPQPSNEIHFPTPGNTFNDQMNADNNTTSSSGKLPKDIVNLSGISSLSTDRAVGEVVNLDHANSTVSPAVHYVHAEKSTPIETKSVQSPAYVSSNGEEASEASTTLPEDEKTPSEFIDVSKPSSPVMEQNTTNVHGTLDGAGSEAPMQFNFERQLSTLPVSETPATKDRNNISGANDAQKTQESCVPAATPKKDSIVKTADAKFMTAGTPRVSTLTDFDDSDFTGLEQASPEDETESFADGMRISEDFESIGNTDLEDELHESGFTGANGAPFGAVVTGTSQQISTQGISEGNDEWNEIFSGFGNSASAMKQPTPPTTLDPPSSHFVIPAIKSPINRKVATTPKSIAVEELSSMGFSEQVAVKALEKCKWDLEAATNFLLDNN